MGALHGIHDCSNKPNNAFVWGRWMFLQQAGEKRGRDDPKVESQGTPPMHFGLRLCYADVEQPRLHFRKEFATLLKEDIVDLRERKRCEKSFKSPRFLWAGQSLTPE